MRTNLRLQRRYNCLKSPMHASLKWDFRTDRPWTWCNRWSPEPPWCPLNTSRLSGLLPTTSLRVEGVRLHLCISTITLSCWSSCALMLSSKGIEIGSMMRALGCDYIYTASNQHHVVRSFRAHNNANENSSPELKNTPNWIVGLTELHEKCLEIRMRWRNKSYNNWIDVYLHSC